MKLEIPTTVSGHGEASGGVGIEVWAPEQQAMGRQSQAREAIGEKEREALGLGLYRLAVLW